MKIAIAQINCLVGAMQENAQRILSLAHDAHRQGASLLVTPEMALCGYPAEDLLFRADFHQANQRSLIWLAEQLPSQFALLVGHPQRVADKHYNAASLLHSGKVQGCYHKQVLPNYGVFDEARYFKAGNAPLVFDWQGQRYGVLICEDIWESAPAQKAKQAQARILIALNASPYSIHKQAQRYQVAQQRVTETELPLIYVNMVGGQDELVFDGASFVIDQHSKLTQALPAFSEQLAYIDMLDASPLQTNVAPNLSIEASVYQALSLGLADYVNKNGFSSVVIGLSGGIDSALTLAIAVDALGKQRVKAVMMPSAFTADMSIEDASTMAKKLEVACSQIAINDLFDEFCRALAPEFSGKAFDTTEENLQARIRGMLLMAISNKFGSMVITTGNKSEMAVGYSTLYGDMAGGFALIKDVSKTLVYQLAHYRNSLSPVIPERIITRAPSAELRVNQTDQDSLPAYEILDAIMQAYVEQDLSRHDIVALGYHAQDVMRVTHLIDRNEYKRQQSAVGVRITERGFGKDRRYPITCKLSFE